MKILPILVWPKQTRVSVAQIVLKLYFYVGRTLKLAALNRIKNVRNSANILPVPVSMHRKSANHISQLADG